MFDLHPRDQPPGRVDHFALVKRLEPSFIHFIENDEIQFFLNEIGIKVD